MGPISHLLLLVWEGLRVRPITYFSMEKLISSVNHFECLFSFYYENFRGWLSNLWVVASAHVFIHNRVFTATARRFQPA